MDENIFVPVSQLNEIRRKAVEKLIEKRLYKIEVKKEKYTIELPDFKQTKQKSILDGTGNYDYIYTSDYNKIKENIYYKVPRVNYEYKEINKHVLIGEVGSIYKYKDFDTDFSFNVVNSYAVAFLHNQGAKKITLSYELDTKQIKDIIDAYHKRYNKHPNLEVITQAQEEVMISKFNLLEYYGIKEGKLRDKFKNLYPIKIKDGLMYIYNYKKRELNEEELYNIGVNVVRINLV